MDTIIKYLKKGELALFIIFLLVFLFFSFASEYFFSVRNIMNVSGQLSITLIAFIDAPTLLKLVFCFGPTSKPIPQKVFEGNLNDIHLLSYAVM